MSEYSELKCHQHLKGVMLVAYLITDNIGGSVNAADTICSHPHRVSNTTDFVLGTMTSSCHLGETPAGRDVESSNDQSIMKQE